MVPNHQSDKYAIFVSQVSIHLPTHPNRILHSPVFLRHQRSRRFLSMSCDFSVWRCGKSFGGLSHVQCLWHGLCLWLCGCEDLVYLCQRSNTHCLKSRMQLSAMSCFKDGKMARPHNSCNLFTGVPGSCRTVELLEPNAGRGAAIQST